MLNKSQKKWTGNVLGPCPVTSQIAEDQLLRTFLPLSGPTLCFLSSNPILCQLSQRKFGDCSKALRKIYFLLSPPLNAEETSIWIWTSRSKSLLLAAGKEPAVHRGLCRSSGGSWWTAWPGNPLCCKQSICLRTCFSTSNRKTNWKAESKRQSPPQ